jgi:hypothetical protein
MSTSGRRSRASLNQPLAGALGLLYLVVRSGPSRRAGGDSLEGVNPRRLCQEAGLLTESSHVGLAEVGVEGSL